MSTRDELLARADNTNERLKSLSPSHEAMEAATDLVDDLADALRAEVARAVTAETDLASACSEIVRWGERATTAETALAALRLGIENELDARHQALVLCYLDAPDTGQPVRQHRPVNIDRAERRRAMLDVPDQPNPTETNT